jgi:E3 ubiquitin-protein ligase MARCH6
VFEIQLPLEMVFLHVLVPLAMDHLRIKVILHEVMTNFFCILCSHLEISEILEHPPAVQVPVSSGVQQDYARSRQISYSARVCLCMLAFMLALAIAASWIVHAPLTLGRGLFIKLGFHVDHDAFNYIVGAVMVFVAVKGSRSLCRELDAVDVHRLATVFAQWIAVCLKVIAISSIWLTIIPLLIGIGFESIAVVPLRTSPNETPRYPVLQCWALGLVFLKIWMRCVFLGGENHWRPIFERVLVQGFWHMNMSMIFREIVFPVLIFLADFVLVPYFVTRLAGVLLDLSYEYRSFLVRFSFIGFAITRCIINGLIELVTILTKLHNSIRDSRYLVGTQLTNRGD